MKILSINLNDHPVTAILEGGKKITFTELQVELMFDPKKGENEMWMAEAQDDQENVYFATAEFEGEKLIAISDIQQS